ncbi:hypothetical protein PC116_g6379 [Phytophthora cactorum]|nr:hypothetical protein PC116_g6379 [Phytophthora cactorum]
MFFAVFVIALMLAPTPSSAFSFLPWFDDTDDSSHPLDVSLASGNSANESDVIPQQPLLDPKDWFLTEQEITDSRGGVPRRDMAVYTTGNKVTSYTATNEFYNAVYDDLSKTMEGDRVMLAAWLAALVPLKPDVDPSGAKTGFKEVFAGVVERGGNVNILGWASIAGAYMRYNIKARDAINSIPPSSVNGAKALYIFDDRIDLISSHHQKTLVIVANSSSDKKDQPVAYVGGVDLAIDRWDTKYHNNTAVRDAGKITYKSKGWVDGHIRIHGPAAKDVASNFIARWNSDYLPCQNLDDKFLDFVNPAYKKIPPLDYTSSKTTSRLGNQSVQITRTFSCQYEHYKEFAPKGENSLFQARIKAIKNAKNFIYVEDQYFVFVPELLDALMEVMPRIQRLIVVTKEQTNAFTNAGYIKYLYQMVEPIRSKYPNKFRIYTTKAKRKLLIHSKLVIIDDVYLSIGSANWNRRSMTADPELNADVVDGDTVKSPDGVTVGKLPRDFRIRKFMEMTGLSYGELDAMTFVEAADQFAVAATNKSTILATNTVKHHLYFFAITDAMRKVSDPQFICNYDDRNKMSSIDEHVVHDGKGKARTTRCRHCNKLFASRSKNRWSKHMRGCESFTRSTWTAGNITKAGLLREENEIIVLYCVGSLTDSPTILRDLELINNRVIVVSLNGVKSRYPTIYSRWCAVGLWAAIVQFGAGCGKESFCPAHSTCPKTPAAATLCRCPGASKSAIGNSSSSFESRAWGCKSDSPANRLDKSRLFASLRS